MDSLLLTISDAVADELNSQTDWSHSFKAVRANLPEFKREELENLHVIVRPKSLKRRRLNRASWLKTTEVWVLIQKGLKGKTNAESDKLVNFGNEIQDYFVEGLKLASYPAANCTGSDFGDPNASPFLAVEEQENAGLYKGIIVLEFQTLVDVNG